MGYCKIVFLKVGIFNHENSRVSVRKQSSFLFTLLYNYKSVSLNFDCGSLKTNLTHL